MTLWMLTGVLFVVTVAAFFWARSSGAPASTPKKRSRAPSAPNASGASGALDDSELADAYGADDADRAEGPGAEPVTQARSGNALAWATFAISAFGTTSTFVLSLLTYLKSTS